MDFGFANLIDKFEEYFGRIATKVLLGFVGLAVLGFSGSIIFNNIIVPAYNILLQIVSPDRNLEVNNAITTAANIFLMIWVLYLVVNAFNKKSTSREIERYRDEYEQYTIFVADFYATISSFLANISQLRNEAYGRLTKRKKDDLQETLSQMEAEIDEIQNVMGKKILELNSMVYWRDVDEADQPQIDDFDESEIKRDKEENAL